MIQEEQLNLKILYDGTPAALREAFGFEKGKQRLLWYTDKLPKTKWVSVYCVEDAQSISYSECTVTAKMGTKLYPSKTQRKGFTFGKSQGKIKLWYGCSINQLTSLSSFLIEFKKEWVVRENVHNWLTKTLLEKILSNGITNPKEASQHILKTLRIKDVSPEALRLYIKSGRYKNDLLMVKDALINVESVCKKST